MKILKFWIIIRSSLMLKATFVPLEAVKGAKSTRDTASRSFWNTSASAAQKTRPQTTPTCVREEATQRAK